MNLELQEHQTDLEDLPQDDFYDGPEDYRALSSAAVASLVLGVLSILALLDWWLAVVPLFGAVMAVYALRQIGRHPEEFTGTGVARAGLVLSVLLLAVGWSRLGYIYATEVPDGFQRIGYDILQPDEDVRDQKIPPSAIELDGHKVFIKGYVYPDGQQQGITRFLLVRDQGDCCFGGNPKITDRIEVRLAAGQSMNFSPRLHKVAGVLRIKPTTTLAGLGGVYYHLEEAELR